MQRHRLVSSILLASLLVGGCTNITPPPLFIRSTQAPREVLKAPEHVTNVANRFLDEYQKSYASPYDGTLAQRMTLSGMTLIEVRCDLFFETIGKGSQGLDFTHREIETVSGALIAALGVANVAKDAVTGVGLGANAAARSLDNFGDVFFFSPDVASVQQLVETAELAVRHLAFTPGKEPKTFDEAIGYLRQYQNICTAHQIKSLVNASVAGSHGKASFSDAEDTPVQAAVNSYLPLLAKSLGLPMLTLDQVVLLKWASETPDAPYRLLICASFDASLKAKFCDGSSQPTFTSMSDPIWALAAEGVSAIDKIDPAYLATKLKDLKQSLAPQAAILVAQSRGIQDAMEQLQSAKAQLTVERAKGSAEGAAAAAKIEALTNQIASYQMLNASTISGAQAIAKQAIAPEAGSTNKIEIKVVGNN